MTIYFQNSVRSVVTMRQDEQARPTQLVKKPLEVLGNVRVVVSDKKLSRINSGTHLPEEYRADVLLERDFYAFGMEMPGATFTPDAYRYGFNGMERDDEVKGGGMSYVTFFRVYDPRLGKWNSIDPMTQFVGGQYSAMVNNPVVNVDRNGGWVPEVKEENKNGSDRKTGYLIARMEKGDDFKSLGTFLGINEEEAKSLFDSRSEEGTVKIPENIAGAINASINDYLNPDGSHADYIDDWLIADKWESNYNCWESALSISKGKKPDFNNCVDEESIFCNEILKSGNYENVSESPEKWRFGRTVINFGEEESIIGFSTGNYESIHAATFLGVSRNGMIYTWTKNGRIDAPQVSKLSEVLRAYPETITSGCNQYGKGGYYNFNMR